jgi:PAS domain S-box-containing protein
VPEAAQPAAPRLRFSLAPKASRLLRARDRLRDYLTLHCSDQKTIDDVVLAIEEACTNAIRHSGSSWEIEIRLSFEGDDLHALVKDQGHGFDIAAFDPQKLPDVMATGGRGLFLIAHLMDEMELSRDGGLEVCMVKKAVARCEAPGLESGLGEINAAPQLVHRQARLRSMLEEIDEAFIALDWEYRYVHANEAALRMAGKSRAELLGRKPWDIWATYADTPAGEAIRAAMELGRPSVVEYQAVASGAWLEARVYPTSAGISAYFREISERKRVEDERQRLLERSQAQAQELQAQSEALRAQTKELAERVRFAEALNRISHLVHSSLEFDKILQRSLDEAVSALHSDAGLIELREEGAWVVRSQCGSGPIDLGMRLTDAQSPIAMRALRSREAVAVGDLSTDPDAAAGFLGGHGSILCVPLIIREEVIGALLFHGRDSRVFRTSEIDFARTLSATVSLALANLQIYERDSQAARLGTALTGGSLVRATRRLRAHPWLVLLITLLIQAAYLVPLGTIGQTRNILGIPGSLLAATAVVAGTLAGPLIGTLVAALGGGLFFVTVAQLGTRSSLIAVAISTVMWMGAGLLSGLLARGLREQAQRRLRTSVALAKAETARQEQLVDLSNLQRVASTLQEHFLHPLPTIDGLELAALSLPAARGELIGGDFHDVFVLPDGMVCALIGDVMGKGIAAAGMTETVRSAVRTLALISSSPAYILANVNRLLLHEGEHQQLVTVLLVMLDPENGRGFLASAGHPPAVYLCDLGRRLIEPAYGLPLGALEQSFVATGFALASGEALVLYTDGLTEARRGGELFGEARLLRVLAGAHDGDPQHLVEHMQKAVVDYAGELKDDLQILVLRRT